MKKTILLFICTLLCLSICACSAKDTIDTNTDPVTSENSAEPEVIVAPYERVGTYTLNASFVAPISFAEAVQTSDLCVTVEIKELVDYYMYDMGYFGISVFSATILETHFDQIGYESTEIYITQIGSPIATFYGYPLFNIGDRFLFNLTATKPDALCYADYSNSFSIVNGPSGIIQLTEYNGATYAIDRSFFQYILPSASAEISNVNSAVKQKVLQSLLSKDPILTADFLANKDIFVYDSLVTYISKLKEESTHEKKLINPV